MKILIQGAGLGGCTAASALAQTGHDVTVVEKRKALGTGNAGIVLYSNALKCIDTIGLLDTVMNAGITMQGNTEIWSHDSTLLGVVQYKPVDAKYPSYMGINRFVFLKILYENALSSGAKFKFGTSIVIDSVNGSSEDQIRFTDGSSDQYDLIIAADGTNSELRTSLFKDQESIFTRYGLWHSMHKRRPEVNEKITVIGKGSRLGFIPMTDDTMYIWASIPEPEKVHIDKKDQPRVMREKFSNYTGLAGEVINEIDDNTYVHYTAVEEVHLPKPWFSGNVVLIGDSAHASLPFMAQGGAQALHDAIALTQILNSNEPSLEQKLQQYTDFRFDVAKTVQTMSHRIGDGYRDTSTIDMSKAQNAADLFYLNTGNFTLPCDI